MSAGLPLKNDGLTSPILPVSALNQAVARVLERNFPLAWISGEVSNFTRAASGHWYFTLKDDAAQARAVMFRGRAQLAGFTPQNGDRVEVRALVTLYAPRGDFQLNVEAIRHAGAGNLYEAFLKLKDKLTAEGLFAHERKRPLPVFPRTIGIVTSLQAAALHDVLTSLKRRAPHVSVILYPAPVQGDSAGQKIAKAIASASTRAECDVLLLCRGGGSLEDLWSFNEEIVARAIVASRIPVISGVGHETDVTIADFAADLRAPTPTAAAEMATRAQAEWIAHLGEHTAALTRALHRRINNAGQTMDRLSRRLLSPAERIARERMALQSLSTRAAHAGRTPVTVARHALTSLATQLELLNPQRTLARGYAIVTDAAGVIVRSPAQLHPKETIGLRLAEGEAKIDIGGVERLP
jgi:exodeoxyribonuclease VII large subunit